MDLTGAGRSIRRISILSRNDAGELVPMVVYERKRKRRKGTWALRPLERLTRRWAEANLTASERYVRDHNEANVKRRDGWIRDLNRNLRRANRKGLKKLDLDRLVAL